MERRLIEVGSGSVAVGYHAPAAEIPGPPLLVALPGGTCTSEYFGVAGEVIAAALDVWPAPAPGRPDDTEFLDTTMAMLCGRPGVETTWTRSR